MYLNIFSNLLHYHKERFANEINYALHCILTFFYKFMINIILDTFQKIKKLAMHNIQINIFLCHN